ncbi:uncharacterized protein ARMOST_02324 [Armillaria ostoyae]|uniref:Uncharacterized protein n=1 Tax=Armillaria ostoyae TaxID=47428 RepID=A0A284QRD6_ARMOS|nr:uncharacterized protein ARMOST_02324 [Armillaria ostoyae]
MNAAERQATLIATLRQDTSPRSSRPCPVKLGNVNKEPISQKRLWTILKEVQFRMTGGSNDWRGSEESKMGVKEGRDRTRTALATRNGPTSVKTRVLKEGKQDGIEFERSIVNLKGRLHKYVAIYSILPLLLIASAIPATQPHSLFSTQCQQSRVRQQSQKAPKKPTFRRVGITDTIGGDSADLSLTTRSQDSWLSQGLYRLIRSAFLTTPLGFTSERKSRIRYQTASSSTWAIEWNSSRRRGQTGSRSSNAAFHNSRMLPRPQSKERTASYQDDEYTELHLLRWHGSLVSARRGERSSTARARATEFEPLLGAEGM